MMKLISAQHKELSQEDLLLAQVRGYLILAKSHKTNPKLQFHYLNRAQEILSLAEAGRFYTEQKAA